MIVRDVRRLCLQPALPLWPNLSICFISLLIVYNSYPRPSQGPAGQVEYELIGEGSATTYFQVGPTGQIQLKSSLLQDTADRYIVSGVLVDIGLGMENV